MYINAPDRRVLLMMTSAVPEDFRLQVGNLLQYLQDQLSRAGITATLEQADDEPIDLLLTISAAQTCATLAYNWMNWRQNRKLADLIAEELRAATNLVLSEGRVSLTLGRGAGAPALEVSLPTQAEWSPEPVARSLFRGMARAWNCPLQQTDPEPVPEAPEEPPDEISQEDEERIILPTAPITSRPLLLRPSPASPSPTTDLTDTPPAPAQAPAGTPGRPKAAPPRAVAFVISQASFSTRLIKATHHSKR